MEEIYAVGNVLIEPELHSFGDVDTSLITMKFANGAIGMIDNSRQAVFGYDQRLEVLCLNGTAIAIMKSSILSAKAIRMDFIRRASHFFMQRLRSVMWKRCASLSMRARG